MAKGWGAIEEQARRQRERWMRVQLAIAEACEDNSPCMMSPAERDANYADAWPPMSDDVIDDIEREAEGYS